MRVSTLSAFNESGAAAEDGFGENFVIGLVSGTVL